MQRLFLAALVFAAVHTTTAAPQQGAQAQPDNAVPIEITEKYTAGVTTGGPFTLHLVNRSNKAIAAYSVIVRYLNSEGRTILAGTHLTVTNGILPNLSAGVKMPSEQWTDILKQVPEVDDSRKATVTAELDYAVFADGSSWGPDRGKQERVINGMVAAVKVQSLR